MVRICDLIAKGTDILTGCVEFPKSEAQIILSHILKKDKIFLLVHKDYEAGEKEENEFFNLCKRRSLGEPSAYLVGEKEFMSLPFTVNKSVLIPRPDTEITVQAIIDKYENESIKILDLCTGSGAIACSLAHYIKGAVVTGTDICDDALSLAKENARNLGVEDRVSFIKEDALSIKEKDEKFDVVVSNPPYIRSDVIDTLDRDVKNFEPKIALDGGCDGLIFYRKIVDNIEKVLSPFGEIYFEIGFDQGEDVKNILSKKFEKMQVIKDFSLNDRLVTGQLRYDSK